MAQQMETSKEKQFESLAEVEKTFLPKPAGPGTRETPNELGKRVAEQTLNRIRTALARQKG